jgi:hypothetical protein
VQSATATVYDASGETIESLSPVVVAATNSAPLTLYVEHVFDVAQYPEARDYHLQIEVCGTLNDVSATLRSTACTILFDVVTTGLAADITRFDLLAREPELAFVDAIREEAGASAFILQAHQRLCARMRSTTGYTPNAIVDTSAWQRCLLMETLSMLYAAYPEGTKAREYAARSREAWRVLCTSLRGIDGNGSVLPPQRADSECMR